MAQVRAFLEAIEQGERLELAARFALMVTAQRGGPAEIKSLLRELQP
ncbi:MAG: hypothetical protein Q8O33_05480 [Pseudomonadota bacterium]|nr:hypothetical protein [Pseudomonadota bacterium]